MTLVARIVFCLLVATDFTAINISHIQAQGNSVDETIVLPPVVHDITMNYECKKNHVLLRPRLITIVHPNKYNNL